MNKQSLYKIQDILEELKKIEELILVHTSNHSSDFVISQYQDKKTNLVSILVEELSAPSIKSASSLFLIRKILDKYVNEPVSERLNKVDFNYFKQLEAII